jgi:hypothetical protein
MMAKQINFGRKTNFTEKGDAFDQTRMETRGRRRGNNHAKRVTCSCTRRFSNKGVTRFLYELIIHELVQIETNLFGS